MKKALLLLALLGGSASAVNLSELTTEDICYNTKAFISQAYPNDLKEYKSTIYIPKPLEFLERMGFASQQVKKCQYNLVALMRMSYFSSFPFTEKPTVSIEFNLFLHELAADRPNYYVGSSGYHSVGNFEYKDLTQLDRDMSELVEAVYFEFIKDWFRVHR